MTDQEWEEQERHNTHYAIAAMMGARYWPGEKCYVFYTNQESQTKFYDLDMKPIPRPSGVPRVDPKRSKPT
jgi:hypothetical protein